MRTRNSNFPNNSNVTIPRRRNRGRAPNVVEPELRTIVEVAPMAERTMEELLRALTKGYGEAIVLPEINADHFEIKTNLLQLVQASPFHGYERENPHAHINSFKRITSTLRFRDVPNDVIKLMMFPYSLEGAAKVWYEKEPPNSILTWEDLWNEKPRRPWNTGANKYSKEGTPYIPPPVNPIPIPEPDVPKTLPKPNIPYPSRRNDQKSRDKASNQMEKIFQIFQDLRFDISFADALLLMPRFAPTIKNLLMNKEKLLELAKIPLNENCSAMLLKKLPEKLGDPDKFLIPYNSPRMDVCHALADLRASINLMPFSIWKKLSLPKLTPNRMTLELADRSITHPKGVAEDPYRLTGKLFRCYLRIVSGSEPGHQTLLSENNDQSSHASRYVFRSGPVWGCDSLVSRAKVIENQVMAISVILISLDSSEDSVGTPVGRVILFGTILTTIPDTTPVISLPATQTDTPVIPTETPIIAPTIPQSPNYKPASLDYSPASDSESGTSEDQSSNHVPPLPAILPFLSSDDDTTDNDTPDTPPSPTHEASLDFHSDASSDSYLRYSLSDHYSPNLPGTSAGQSRKRRRSPTTSVPTLSPVSGALSPVCDDLIPSPKRVKDSGYLTDVEVDPREISLRDDAIVRVSDEPHLEQDIDPEIQAKIDECMAYANALRDRGIDARVIVEAIEGVQREQGHRIVRVESAVIALTERIAELERDNKRLRGTASVESQGVDRLQRGMSRMQRELRQMRRLRFYDQVRVSRLEACARKHMGYRP
ncbi:hypothetical protein Tco_0164117 [Tanacetum coccineum]